MQPSLVTPVERPLRRVSSVRSALEAQSANNDCFCAQTDRGDNKSEKAGSYMPGLLPQSGRGLEMGSISESDHGSESIGFGHRRTLSGELGVRKNRNLVSYFLGAILSLFLLVQIVTGGLGLLSSPITLSGVKQVQAAFLVEKHSQVMEGRMDVGVDHWKPLARPLQRIANSEPWHLLSNKLQESQQSFREGQTPLEEMVHELPSTSYKRPAEIRLESKSAADSVDSKVAPLEREESTEILKSDAKDQESWFLQPTYKFEQCMKEDSNHRRPSKATDGYLLNFANGGLNQMRTAIVDMVAVARVMNATLVIPELDHTSYWADPSAFGDVFDVDHFISALKDDATIVTKLPDEMKNIAVYEMAPRSWSETTYYEEEIAPLLRKHKVVKFILTDSRLANNRIPDEIQRLRCKANYQALKFEPSIEELGNKIINRLRAKGPYITLHLRFEKDMLAFSGCTFGLSEEEAEELKLIRYNVTRWKEKEIDPIARRLSGGCPLTPHEIGFMLRAMGYPRKTMIYVAAGQIYGGEERMKTFTSLFPNVVTKETIATAEELAPFVKYQNRLAAIDYMVAVEADVFVPSYDGNMARAVQGHRRFQGHKTTLIPDRVGLVKLFDSYHQSEIDWSTLQKQVVKTHRNRQGAPHYRKVLSPSRAKLEENFYANPLPGCICETDSTSQTQQSTDGRKSNA